MSSDYSHRGMENTEQSTDSPCELYVSVADCSTNTPVGDYPIAGSGLTVHSGRNERTRWFGDPLIRRLPFAICYL